MSPRTAPDAFTLALLSGALAFTAACSGGPEHPTDTPEEPTPTALPYPYAKQLYVRGTFNGWTGDEAELAPYALNAVNATELYAEVTIPFGSQRFKVADSGWSSGTNFGNPAGTDDVIVLGNPKVMGDNGFDLLLDVETSGVYSFTVDHTELLSPSVVVQFVREVDDVCAPDLSTSKARWMQGDALMWKTAEADHYALYYAATGGIDIADGALSGGQEIPLSLTGKVTAGDDWEAVWPYLKGQDVFTPDLSGVDVDALLKGQLVAVAYTADGAVCSATGVQTYGILDERDTYEGDDLGLSFDGGDAVLKLWAPTAQSVSLKVFADATTSSFTTVSAAEGDKGVWTASFTPSGEGQTYLWSVDVYMPSEGEVVVSDVTDPYSVGLSANSQRSLVLDLDDPSLKPEGWDALAKPPLDAPEDIVLYELHVRDFSASDASVPPAERGRFLAFTEASSDGMKHLAALATAGLTHVHLLPSFDIATVEEDEDARVEPSIPQGEGPASEAQQAAVNAARGTDGFNWGYDPWHYGVPEGSYASDPDGPARIVEFRRMVMGLSGAGLRVVMDQVYNHTNAALLGERSVFDKIVPGYYYRLDDSGNIQGSSCCPDTATEHAMMEKLMIDMVVRWARQYKVDGFRFDLMGHHTTANMRHLRERLDALTPGSDGVDGQAIYLYGEGWKFGSLDAILPKQAASQANTFGLGIGTFNDRIRDSVRGGSPFAPLWEQGFATGLYTDDNLLGLADGQSEADLLEDDKATLLNLEDNIRIGLAGNLRDFAFTGADGEEVKGSDIIYRGAKGAGYTADPQEIINYVSVHDNQTLWDNIQAKAPFETAGRSPETASVDDRVRMQNLSLSLIGLGQGIPFFHAGVDLLRSKSGDKDSYDSGDWFNRIDWSGEVNNWGVGLPIADKNQSDWDFWEPRLEASALSVDSADIQRAEDHLQELLQIRRSSALFRLRTAAQIEAGVRFLNAEAGEDQIPGLIVMHLDGEAASAADRAVVDPLINPYKEIVVLFNANPGPVTFSHPLLEGGYAVHPVLAESTDPIVKAGDCSGEEAEITVPGRTTMVCVR